MSTPFSDGWRRPERLLLLMAAGVPLSFATWQALLNNFAIWVASSQPLGPFWKT